MLRDVHVAVDVDGSEVEQPCIFVQLNIVVQLKLLGEGHAVVVVHDQAGPDFGVICDQGTSVQRVDSDVVVLEEHSACGQLSKFFPGGCVMVEFRIGKYVEVDGCVSKADACLEVVGVSGHSGSCFENAVGSAVSGFFPCTDSRRSARTSRVVLVQGCVFRLWAVCKSL